MESTYTDTLASSVAAGGDGETTAYHLAMTSANATAEATDAMTNALKFATSKSVRTSTIILASFNSIAAFATALGIIYGCYRHKKRAQRSSSNASAMQYEMKPRSIPTPYRPSGLFFIHTIEVFPLVLSLGISIQSVVFAIAQSIGLKALLSRGCTVAAVFMLPALFIAPYIQLVFGVETAVRGFRSQFSARRRWNVAICLGTVAALLLVSLLVAFGDKAPDYCFASLFWILEHYAVGGFVLFLLISIALVIAVSSIIMKLIRSHAIDPTERMAASRMVYYLVLGIISNAFLIPFFLSLTFLDQRRYIFETLNLSMVASVVSNVNGLMVACLHMFLRSQNNTAIGHNYGDYDKAKHNPRDSSDEYCGSTHSLQPVINASNDNRATAGSIAMLQHIVGGSEVKIGGSPPLPDTLPDNRPTITVPRAPTFPEPTQPPSATSPSELRKMSYSLFPNTLPATAATLPATTYSSMTTTPTRDSFRPPPIVKPWLGRGHKRESSIESSATVQIGIRLSNVDDFQPSKFSMDTQRPPLAVRPSPSAQFENRPTSEELALESFSFWDARMKTLPPVPLTCVGDKPAGAAGPSGTHDGDMTGSERRDENEPVTLNASVYTPESSPSRRSVNRSARASSLAGVRTSMTAGRGNSDRGSVHAPPRPNGSTVAAQVPATKADWI